MVTRWGSQFIASTCGDVEQMSCRGCLSSHGNHCPDLSLKFLLKKRADATLISGKVPEAGKVAKSGGQGDQ